MRILCKPGQGQISASPPSKNRTPEHENRHRGIFLATDGLVDVEKAFHPPIHSPVKGTYSSTENRFRLPGSGFMNNECYR